MVIEHGIATRRPLGVGGILWHQPQKNPGKKERQKNEKERQRDHNIHIDTHPKKTLYQEFFSL